MRRFAWLAGFCLFLTNCGPTSPVSQDFQSEHSQLHFKTFNPRSCGLADARVSEFKICVAGNADAATKQKFGDWTRLAVSHWFETLRAIDPQVTKNIVVSCEGEAHLNVNMRPGDGTSFAGCGSTPRMTVYSKRTYGTVLHEAGHAVAGLADTYTGRRAGACQAGQPESLMCWGAYGKRDNKGMAVLYRDDIKGIQSQYAKLTGVSVSEENDIPATFPLGAFLDTNQNGVPAGTDENIYVYVRQISAQRSILLASAPQSTPGVGICVGHQQSDCLMNTSASRRGVLVKRTGGRNIFQLPGEYDTRKTANWTLLAGPQNLTASTVSTTRYITFAPR